MNEYVVRPLAPNGKKILDKDITVVASSPYTAKIKAAAMCPNCHSYEIVDEEMTGMAGLQRLREKSGFGMIY